MNQFFIKSAALAASALVLTSCATMFSGSTQTMHVQAIDSASKAVISGARCTLSDGKATVYTVSSNPGSVVVSRGKGAMQAHCSAPGYEQSATGVGTSFNAWTVVNVLFWPGLIVDGVSGAYSKYPDHVTVLMTATAAPAKKTTAKK